MSIPTTKNNHSATLDASYAEMLAKLAQLQAENETLKVKATTRQAQGLSCKVSIKGGLSVYGLGRWPVTLYRAQWERLFAKVNDIQAFMASHASEFTEKD